MDPRDYGEPAPVIRYARTAPDEPAARFGRGVLTVVAVLVLGLVLLPAVNAVGWWLARWIGGWS